MLQLVLQLRGVFVRHQHQAYQANQTLERDPLLSTVNHANASALGLPKYVLSDVNLSVEQGEQIALIGPSGAGKTTLLHTLACAHRPELGSFHLFDQQPWLLSHRVRHLLRRQFIIAPQTPPLPPRQRVITTVLAGRLPQWSLWQAIRNLIKPIAARDAFEALKKVQLQDKLFIRVDRLSGGERQRCGLARLFISNAKLFLVDEPLAALDPQLSVQILQNIQQEARERNASLICSLHQVDLARAHFKRIVGLRDGKIVFDVPQDCLSDSMVQALYHDDSALNSLRNQTQETPSPTPLVLDPRCL